MSASVACAFTVIEFVVLLLKLTELITGALFGNVTVIGCDIVSVLLPALSCVNTCK